MPKQRRRTGPPRCRHCRSVITFYLGPTNTGWLPFEPTPVDPGSSDLAYPVMGRKAWDRNALVAEIQIMRGADADTAAAEIRDMSWYRLHRCAPGAAAWAATHQHDDEGAPR